jgi:hypothetical protein
MEFWWVEFFLSVFLRGMILGRREFACIWHSRGFPRVLEGSLWFHLSIFSVPYRSMN